MKKYIVGDYTDEQITDQMVKWVNAAGKPLVGLKKRRIAEANMFLGYDKYYLDEKNNIKKK
jgi:GH24 family phage-related lysozyme (muramidase)